MSGEVYKRRVKDIITKDLVTIGVADTVHEALVLMGENRVSALPVVDQRDRCVGILSAADLVDLTRDTDDDLRDLDCVDLSTKRFLIDRLAHSLGSCQPIAIINSAHKPSSPVRRAMDRPGRSS